MTVQLDLPDDLHREVNEWAERTGMPLDRFL